MDENSRIKTATNNPVDDVYAATVEFLLVQPTTRAPSPHPPKAVVRRTAPVTWAYTLPATMSADWPAQLISPRRNREPIRARSGT